MLKIYLKSYAYLFASIIISIILLSILNYFLNIPSFIIKIILPIIILFITSIYLGKNSKESAYLEGLKFSSIYLIFITIIKLIFKTGFNFKVIIIYITILFAGILGAMIGINLKKN